VISKLAHVDSTAVIRAASVELADDVVIEGDVRIACDRLALGPGTVIRRGTRIVAPEISCGATTTIGAAAQIELNARFRVGALADFGRGVRVTGHALDAGDHLWITDGVVIGGGGARGPRACLTIGDRSALMDGCFVNVCEPVSIGSDTALSNNVTVLTHSTWHPALTGGTPLFAPVVIGDDVIVYVNAVIGPGVQVGSHCTIGAGAVVTRDVPERSTAFGNPARLAAIAPSLGQPVDAARQDEIVRAALREYCEGVPLKGGRIVAPGPDTFEIELAGVSETIRYLPGAEGDSAAASAATITLSMRDVPPGRRGRCHFDLSRRALVGEASTVAEDLRDFLRRRTIRVYTDRPFRSLPPASIARLRRELES
jgi:acetyltransferase-like isoleucine patch superfamily enzyme